ncbi:hypothetical protein NZD89_22460 [Alicyclobacillus fastidiosus]|uniref:Uncharacterized protein n=1 Tax=Alicyclobacillus fastidiosus TaxID=392011 RepID=A0ABY6ZG10_9BACL|nr:hypothetical protein [Alicyclobacillus fastidiosus]WAH41021.1 hypothetical protein NZD89_22460 [Alicyclobacillus fastidiosus]GMA62543.1 hypothetical protein GCM10025859_29830 [Alicyclobacillus fastidiosus]
MQPERPFRPTFQKAFLAFCIVLCTCVVAISAIQLSHAKQLAKQNLFQLVGNLDVTTSQILHNTRQLDLQVSHVAGQLNELTTQEEILGQQQTTGQALSTQLSTQVVLTERNVALMQQILTAEEHAGTAAVSVQRGSQTLAGVIARNSVVLSQLDNTLGTTNSESNQLSAQMDNLLGALATSQQEFRLFGQVDQILGGNPLGGATSLLGQATGGLLGSKNPLTSVTGGLTHSLQGGSSKAQSSSSSGSGQGTSSARQNTTSRNSTSNSTSGASGGGLLGGLLGSLN